MFLIVKIKEEFKADDSVLTLDEAKKLSNKDKSKDKGNNVQKKKKTKKKERKIRKDKGTRRIPVDQEREYFLPIKSSLCNIILFSVLLPTRFLAMLNNHILHRITSTNIKMKIIKLLPVLILYFLNLISAESCL